MTGTLFPDNKKVLLRAYEILSPYSDKARWEFDSHLCHLNWLTSNIAKNATVLDVGCGIGILALSLKLLGFNVEGYDKFVFMEKTNYTVGDLVNLQKIWDDYHISITPHDVFDEWSAKQYDVVVTIATIEHQARPRAFLECLKHVVRSDGGIIYLATPNVAHLLNRFRCFLGRPQLSNLRELYEADANFVGHFREYTLEELKQMFSWPEIDIMYAKQLQDKKPKWPRTFREVYVNMLRAIARFIPSFGEANIIVGRS